MLNRILVKKKSEPEKGSFIVYRQGDGYPCIVEEAAVEEEFLKEEEILFPDVDESGRALYEAAALQGLLANPNIVKSLKDLDNDEDFRIDLMRVVDRVSALMFFGGCLKYKAAVSK